MGIFDNFFNGYSENQKSSIKNRDAYENMLNGNPYYNEDVFSEMAEEIHVEEPRHSYNSYLGNGVCMEQTGENTMRIVYNGILAKSGANEVYSVVGYGNNLRWDNVEQYHMNRIGHKTFEVVLPIKSYDNINMAFKDSAEHWDNNSGINYTFAQ